ncbi:MAG: SBBP repeat-containing protein [Sedimentisphaerales bacterium]|nr:SBBP repeat-containing protein [Sedimentisphaerales bacterium]
MVRYLLLTATLAMMALGLCSCGSDEDATASSEIAWSRQVDTDKGGSSWGVAVDGDGNVFIGGRTEGDMDGANAGGNDAFLIKYDADGGRVWTRQLGTNKDDIGFAVAVDGGGNSYIAGMTAGDLAGYDPCSVDPCDTEVDIDAYIAKYDAEGEQVWLRQLGTTEEDAARGVAVDAAGNVYVSGYTMGGLGGENAEGFDAFLVKYDADGEQVWIRQLSTNADDKAYSVTVDDAGAVYVCGETENAGGIDAFVAKYDADGNEIWIRQMGTGAIAMARAIAVDSEGNVFVSGVAGDVLGDGEAFLAKYDAEGQQLWMRQLGGSGFDISLAVAVDGADNVYISGQVEESFEGDDFVGPDAFVAKYDGAGNQIWVKQPATNEWDLIAGLAVDTEGNVYVSRSTVSGEDGDDAVIGAVALFKYLALDDDATTDEGEVADPCDVEETASEEIAEPGDVEVVAFEYSGAEQERLWQYQLGTKEDDWLYSLTVDGAGNVLICGSIAGDLLTNDTEDENGAAVAGAGAIAEEVAALEMAMAEGFAVVEYGVNGYVAKYDGAGRQLWMVELGTEEWDTVHAVTVDAAGDVFISGNTAGSLAGENMGRMDAYIARYDANGNQIWITQLGTNRFDATECIAVDGEGNVYIAGTTAGDLEGIDSAEVDPCDAEDDEVDMDAYVAKYDADGNQLWVRQLGTDASDGAYCVVVDGDGNVYVGGNTAGSLDGENAGDMDVFVAVYDAEGEQVHIMQVGTSGPDTIDSLVLDAAGDVYLSGNTYGNMGGENAGDIDAFVCKYDAEWNRLWVRQLGTVRWDRVCGMVAGGAGGVLICGETRGGLAGANVGIMDAYWSEYDAEGNQLWVRQLGTTAEDMARAIAVDGAGNVLVGGVTEGSLGGVSAGGVDAFLVKCAIAVE